MRETLLPKCRYGCTRRDAYIFLLDLRFRRATRKQGMDSYILLSTTQTKEPSNWSHKGLPYLVPVGSYSQLTNSIHSSQQPGLEAFLFWESNLTLDGRSFILCWLPHRMNLLPSWHPQDQQRGVCRTRATSQPGIFYEHHQALPVKSKTYSWLFSLYEKVEEECLLIVVFILSQ